MSLTHLSAPTLLSIDLSPTLSTRKLIQQEMCACTLPAYKFVTTPHWALKLRLLENGPNSLPHNPHDPFSSSTTLHSSQPSCTLSPNKKWSKKDSQNNLCPFLHLCTCGKLLKKIPILASPPHPFLKIRLSGVVWMWNQIENHWYRNGNPLKENFVPEPYEGTWHSL